MLIPDVIPLAPDGLEYCLSHRFMSVYTWGRPPIPAGAANTISAIVNKSNIRMSLIMGSCCGSVITAIGFGMPERIIKLVDMCSRWGEGYSEFLADCDTEIAATYPRCDYWLPHKPIFYLQEWNYGPRLGEMVYVDLPGGSYLVRTDLVEMVESVRPKLVVMGFMDGYEGPSELEKYLVESEAWIVEERLFYIKNHETTERRAFRLVVAGKKAMDSMDVAATDSREREFRRFFGNRNLSQEALGRSNEPNSQATSPQIQNYNSLRESIRSEFRPEKVEVLFIGESPPANGTFFYENNSNLARRTAEAMEIKLEEVSGEFLRRGFYLVDLCDEPINALSRSERRRVRKESEANLADKIKDCNPKKIVIVMKDIEKNVRRAIELSGLDSCTTIDVFAFPANGHQGEYVTEFRTFLERMRG